MTMKRAFAGVGLILLLSAVMSVACGSGSGSAPDKEVAAALPESTEAIPQRIISLAPSHTETLFELGLEDRIVGVTEYCDYPVEAQQKEKVGGFSTVDMERIIALGPDLILAANIHKGDLAPELKRRGFNVLIVAPQTLEEVLDGIMEVGRATGTAERASELVEDLRTGIAAVQDRVASLEEGQRPRVFYLTWHDPIWTLGKGTITHELIEMAGGRNIMSDTQGHSKVDLESVILRNPQVILAASGHGSAEDSPLGWAQTETRLKHVDARIDGAVHQVDADLVTRPGPRIVKGLELMAGLVHPELFPE